MDGTGQLYATLVTAQAPSVDWQQVAAGLRSAVAKIIHVEEALATNCTCMACMGTFKQPVTCVPCGHCFCKVCAWCTWAA